MCYACSYIDGVIRNMSFFFKNLKFGIALSSKIFYFSGFRRKLLPTTFNIFKISQNKYLPPQADLIFSWLPKCKSGVTPRIIFISLHIYIIFGAFKFRFKWIIVYYTLNIIVTITCSNILLATDIN